MLADGTLIDLWVDAEAGTTALAVCPPDGEAYAVDQFTAPGGEPLRKLVQSRRKAWQSESRAMSVFAAAAIAMTYWQLADTGQSHFS